MQPTQTKTFTFGGVQMTEAEYGVISATVARGTCPYCGRSGMTNRFGSFKRHRSACGARLTLLGKEKLFAEWMKEARESGRQVGKVPHRG